MAGLLATGDADTPTHAHANDDGTNGANARRREDANGGTGA
jgi:hypothetical protein